MISLSPWKPGSAAPRNVSAACRKPGRQGRIDTYRNFSELSGRELAGRDFIIHCTVRNPCGIVVAPHGGRIESFTAEVARHIAGDVLSYYAFVGIKARGNHRLHITSHRFDEPRALDVVAGAAVVLAVHGAGEEAPFVMVGGRDAARGKRLSDVLAEKGFCIRPPGLRTGGVHPLNICNRGKTKQGIQMELGAALRREFMADPLKLAVFARTVQTVLVEAL
jgi:phage replication-related protein YjqB (UPF0714/DUF867 family)